MNDPLPDHQEIEETFVKRPGEILGRLPDCIASRRAKQLLPTIYDYVREAREQAPRPEPTATEGE
jgi:hypothetical protein